MNDQNQPDLNSLFSNTPATPTPAPAPDPVGASPTPPMSPSPATMPTEPVATNPFMNPAAPPPASSFPSFNTTPNPTFASPPLPAMPEPLSAPSTQQPFTPIPTTPDQGNSPFLGAFASTPSPNSSASPVINSINTPTDQMTSFPASQPNTNGLSPIDNPMDMPSQQPSAPLGGSPLPNADQIAATPVPVAPPIPDPVTAPPQPAGFNWSQPATPPPPPAALPVTPTANPESNLPPADTTNAPTLSLQDLYGPSTAGQANPGVGAPTPVAVTPEAPTTPVDQTSAAPALTPAESAPEDLSQLIASQKEAPTVYSPPLSQPQTLVTPPSAEAASPTGAPAEAHGAPIPKWVIGLGVGLLLLVLASSAYFILGIGQTGQPPASAPATNNEQTQITPPETPAPVVEATPEPVAASPEASSSGNFGSVESTGSANSATSALDKLRQRQTTP